jgi:hypothetical protein
VFWEGNFQALIRQYWNLDLKLADIRQMVTEGVVPDEVNDDRAIRIDLFRDSDRSVERVEISGDGSHLTLRVLQRETRQGVILPPSGLGKFIRRERIEDVIGRG